MDLSPLSETDIRRRHVDSGARLVLSTTQHTAADFRNWADSALVPSAREVYRRCAELLEAEVPATGDRGGSVIADQLAHVAVGDSDEGVRHERAARGGVECPALSASGFFCTRGRGHLGRHIAGTGDHVAAVWS